MKKIFFVIVSILFFTQSAFAGKGYTTDTQPATCVDGDFWIDTNGATGERFYLCEEGSWVKSVGYGTSANPSFNSIHASGGNLAAANSQVTKKWITGLPYTANVTSVIYGGKHYICTSSHTADSTTEPGVGASWATVWSEVTGGGVSAWSDIQALLTGTGTYVKADGTTGDPTGTITTGDGVAAAMANALDGTGGLASKAALDALPNIIFGTGITVAEDTPSANYDTVSIDADTTPTDGSAKPITSNAVFDALAGKQNADADLTTASGATGAGNSKYFGTNSSGTAGFYDLPSGSGSFAFDTFPQYEDSAHSSGIAVNGTTLAIYSSTAGKWLTVGLTDTLDAAPVTYAATLTITDASATGDTFTLNSIAYDAADSPVSVSNLPTATEQITYTGSNTAACTGDVTGTGPWTINASPATVGCAITPVVAEFCDGTEVFCTSWETGTDALNTGATGNEDVFETVEGSPARESVSGGDGNYGIVIDTSNEGVYTENGGSYFGSSAWVTGSFKVVSNSIGVGASSSVIYIYNTSSFAIAKLALYEDAGDYDTTMSLRYSAQTTTSSTVQVGTDQTVTMGNTYYFKFYWGSGTSTRFKLYNAAKEIVYDTGDVAITRSQAINRFYINSSNTVRFNLSEIKVTASEPTL